MQEDFKPTIEDYNNSITSAKILLSTAEAFNTDLILTNLFEPIRNPKIVKEIREQLDELIKILRNGINIIERNPLTVRKFDEIVKDLRENLKKLKSIDCN